jgi:polysaccharide biosynthesis protein PslH
MRILWVKSDFLHPTDRGAQIRTLEMLKRLHLRNEIHFIGIENPDQPEGLARSSEYCSYAYPIRHRVPDKTSLAFAGQLMAGVVSSLPVAVTRYKSAAMRRAIAELAHKHHFDAVVCDFLFPAPNMPDLSVCTLFQHNVEAMIWKRRVEHASGLPQKLYLQMQARRMLAYEGLVCRSVKNVIAVSTIDASTMQSLYAISRVDAVPTGVDIDYFAPPPESPQTADLTFVGSMDWNPNIDGIDWFIREVLPLIRKERSGVTLAIVGRKPPEHLITLAQNDPHITVTGTVPDVRPYLWSSLVSIVPLRIGGGTRLKIYEAMAAKAPVVSTTIGAEGLDIQDGDNILLADSPHEFSSRCLALLTNASERSRLVAKAWNLVNSKYSWEVVTRSFERLLA